jgi:hypothetical protein
MKTITSLLSLLIMITGCVQEYKPTYGKVNTGTESSKTSDYQEQSIFRNTEAVSIVNPFNPEREITVGGSNADIQGYTSEAIQTAINAFTGKL